MLSNVTSVLILVLGIYGALLIIAKDTAVPEQVKSNALFQTLYDNNYIVGGVFIGVSYYLYTSLSQEGTSAVHAEAVTTEMTSATPEIPLPTYAEATSEQL
jgi:hypothetical protein